MCRDPEVRKNVNKKQNEWTRQLLRSGSNSVLLEQKSRSRKWWEIRLEILARGLICHTFSLSNMFGHISWASKSGWPILLIGKPCCSWCLHAARAANVPPLTFGFWGRESESWRQSGESLTLTYRELGFLVGRLGHLVLNLAKQKSLCQQRIALQKVLALSFLPRFFRHWILEGEKARQDSGNSILATDMVIHV